MPINASVTNQQITASVSETQIDVSVGGGVGPTGSQGSSGVVTVTAPVTNSGTATAANIGLSVGTGLSVSGGSLVVTPGTYAAATHSHAVSDVTGLQTALDGKAALSHNHDASAINAGTLAAARLPIATANAVGAVRIGTGISIDGNGVISASSAYTLPTATNSVLGGVKIGTGVTITDGVISVNTNYAAASHTHASLTSGDDTLTLDGSGNATLVLDAEFGGELKFQSAEYPDWDGAIGIDDVGGTALYLRSGDGDVAVRVYGGSRGFFGNIECAGVKFSEDDTVQTTAWTGSFSYNDLDDLPTLFDGAYSSLTGLPTLGTAAAAATTDFAAASDFDQGVKTTDSPTFASGYFSNSLFIAGGPGLFCELDSTSLTTDRTILLPDSDGTLVVGSDARLTDARTPTSHTHGNITNAGAIGTTSGLPIITTTSGVLTAGAFGTSAGQFAAGDHTHAQLHDRSHAITSSSDHTATAWRVFYSDGSGVITELALGASGTVLTSAGASAAPTFSALPSGGATNVWIPASAWIPRTTTGCGVDSRETSTNRQNFDELLFDAGTDEFAQALVVMPSNYNAGTITARFYWTASAGSGAVIWGIQGRAFADDDALDTAHGTAQTVTDTLLATNDMHVSGATSAVTVGGTPAANRPIQFQIYRDADAAGDTIANDCRLLGVEISYTAA